MPGAVWEMNMFVSVTSSQQLLHHGTSLQLWFPAAISKFTLLTYQVSLNTSNPLPSRQPLTLESLVFYSLHFKDCVSLGLPKEASTH